MSYKYIFIICLVSLDFLLIANIVSAKSSDVLGVRIVKKKIIKPTPTISIKKSPTPKPTATKAPTPSPTIAPKPTSASAQNSTGDLLTQVNNFRAGKGLDPLIARSEVCFFANMRAQEITTNFNHDGFTSRINSNSLPYPSYSSVAENIAMNSNSQDVVPAWINSPGHNANMSKDVPYGCVVGSGNYYVFEAWKP